MKSTENNTAVKRLRLLFRDKGGWALKRDEKVPNFVFTGHRQGSVFISHRFGIVFKSLRLG